MAAPRTPHFRGLAGYERDAAYLEWDAIQSGPVSHREVRDYGSSLRIARMAAWAERWGHLITNELRRGPR